MSLKKNEKNVWTRWIALDVNGEPVNHSLGMSRDRVQASSIKADHVVQVEVRRIMPKAKAVAKKLPAQKPKRKVVSVPVSLPADVLPPEQQDTPCEVTVVEVAKKSKKKSK